MSVLSRTDSRYRSRGKSESSGRMGCWGRRFRRFHQFRQSSEFSFAYFLSKFLSNTDFHDTLDSSDGLTKATSRIRDAVVPSNGVSPSRFNLLRQTASLLCSRDSPRVILIERFGSLVGLVSVKDCLKYTLAHEHSSSSSGTMGDNGGAEELEATLNELRLWVKDVKRWIAEKVTGREIPGSPEVMRMGSYQGVVALDDSEEDERSRRWGERAVIPSQEGDDRSRRKG